MPVIPRRSLSMSGWNSAMPELPVHFLTIVLNGEPFVRYHIDILRQLPFSWHWHIVEGVAELRHDTAWALDFGGVIPDCFHSNGLSNDGTSQYLDRLQALFPENITVYRPPDGQFWDGKKAMVNAPLPSIKEDCLLWQLDADEFWTLEQLQRGRQLFLENPARSAAWYYCHFFVGPDLLVVDDASSSHRLNANWLRTWRFSPGCRWDAHEPPLLVRPLSDGNTADLGCLRPFLCDETARAGLVFQHKAYVLPSQLRFKELYYGYRGATANWLMLQKQSKMPVKLKEYFPWPFIGEDTLANRSGTAGVESIPLPQQEGDVLTMERDLAGLDRFIDKIVKDVYPEPPSSLHSEITLVALEKLNELFPLKPGMKVLDVGCGQGPALEYFHSRGLEYLGITLGEEDIIACRAKGFNVEKMDQSFLTLPDNSQDMIWARHVIEHSIFPLFTLDGFRRVLRPGGMLYLEAPAPETSCHHERNPNHYSVFSKGSWRSLLERSGFKVLGDVDYSFDVPAGPDVYWGFYCLKRVD